MENNTLSQRISKIIITLVVIVVVALAVAGYFYNQVRILKQDPQLAARQEVVDLVAKVGRLLVLPTGETPTIATVSDPGALKEQPFFALAAKGDKMLIYAQAKKAILYSVALNKILNVAPVNIGAQQAVTPPAPAATPDNSTPGTKPTKKTP